MPNKCFLCGFTYIVGGEVSLHRLPPNQLEREKWLQRISWDQPLLDKKIYYVCSNHFPESCFRIINLRKRLIQGSLPSPCAINLEIPPPSIKTTASDDEEPIAQEISESSFKSGKKYLKTETIPFKMLSSSEHLPSIKTTASDDEKCMAQEISESSFKSGKKNLKTKTIPFRILSSPEHLSSIKTTVSDEKPIAQEISNVVEIVELCDSDSSITVTASDLSATLTVSDLSGTCVHSEVFDDDEEHQAPLPTTPKVEHQVLRPKRKCFVGDVSDDDFSTPERAKFVFSIAQKKLEAQKKAMKALRQKNRRLQQKVSDLSGLLNSLSEQNFISDFALDHMKVRTYPVVTRHSITEEIASTDNQLFSVAGPSGIAEPSSITEPPSREQTHPPCTELEDAPRIKILKQRIRELEKSNILKSRKIKYLQKINWTQKRKISSLKSLATKLKKENSLLGIFRYS